MPLVILVLLAWSVLAVLVMMFFAMLLMGARLLAQVSGPLGHGPGRAAVPDVTGRALLVDPDGGALGLGPVVVAARAEVVRASADRVRGSSSERPRHLGVAPA